jgi:hypothetical protein
LGWKARRKVHFEDKGADVKLDQNGGLGGRLGVEWIHLAENRER